MQSLLKPMGRALARHLTRLRQGLEDLTRRLRDSVAATVGRVADEAAKEVVQALLGGTTSGPFRSQDRSTFWDGRQEDIDQYGDDREPAQAWDDFEEESLPDEYAEQAEPEPAGWRKALVAGCRAGTCWLRRFERYPLLYAVGVGFLSGIASWVDGPFAEAGSSLAASAVALADLAITLHSGGESLGQ